MPDDYRRWSQTFWKPAGSGSGTSRMRLERCGTRGYARPDTYDLRLTAHGSPTCSPSVLPFWIAPARLTQLLLHRLRQWPPLVVGRDLTIGVTRRMSSTSSVALRSSRI